ncbi:MAG: glycoside hydrolase family 57 protein [Candidatus Dojkabacteria bacterium]
MKNICLYLHVHQPLRLTRLNYLEIGTVNDYFHGSSPFSNEEIIAKVANKSYLPTNRLLLKLLRQHPEFRLSLSITGVFIEQLQKYDPGVLKSFQELVETGRVEIVAETYHHSLASIYSVSEFAEQIMIHMNLVNSVFEVKPRIFRNTELIYNDYIASLVKEMGFEAILAEGWDKYLEWRSPNFLYEANTEELSEGVKQTLARYNFSKGSNSKSLKLLLKNYKLSDDIAFRFSNQAWEDHPLSVEKYCKWVEDSPGETINLFMDYETFGEHQWEDTGIFKFLKNLPKAVFKKSKFKFAAPSEVAEKLQPVAAVNVPHPVSWADEERDLTAWLGNDLQNDAFNKLYSLMDKVNRCNDKKILAYSNF